MFDADRDAVARSAIAIAIAILLDARDRSRDRFPRTLYDQQRRDSALTAPRAARPGRSSRDLARRARSKETM